MTQPLLFATPDSNLAPVTQDAAVDCEIVARNYAKETLQSKIAELRCCEQIALQGWRYTLMGDGHPGYDIIAERDDVMPQRVQVKHGFLRSRTRLGKGCTPSYKIRNHANGKIYSATAYDLLVFYMYDRNQWLVYHRSEIGARSDFEWIPPEERVAAHRAGSMSHRAPNDWRPLNEVAESPTANQKSFTPRTANVPPLPVQMSTYP
jgi:hypothetical protein